MSQSNQVVKALALKRQQCVACDAVYQVMPGPSYRKRMVCTECRSRWFHIQGRAMAAVSKAIKQGHLAKPSTLKCADCGGQAREYEHRRYDRFLEVDPICRPCNRRRGHAYLPKDFLPDARVDMPHMVGRSKWLHRFFLPSDSAIGPSPTKFSDAPDCAAITLMVAA